MTAHDRAVVLDRWEAFTGAAGPLLEPIRTAEEFEAVSVLLDEVSDRMIEPDDPRYLGLFRLLCERVAAWEDGHVQMSDAEPREVLRHLMDEHGLRQADLKDVAPQSVISEILSGKRSINARQAKALGARFGVSPAVFL